MAIIPPSTKEQIVLAGERLFAQHGIDGISLRQIGIAAGAANNSVVQYHFGSKDHLVQAIFENRLPDIQHRRRLLLERTDGSLRDLLECQVLPMMEQAERDGSHYLTFIAMVRQHRRVDVLKSLSAAQLDSARVWLSRLDKALVGLPKALRRQRTSRALTLLLQCAADREQANAEGRSILAFPVDVEDLLDCVEGILLAPASPVATAAARRAPGTFFEALIF